MFQPEAVIRLACYQIYLWLDMRNFFADYNLLIILARYSGY